MNTNSSRRGRPKGSGIDDRRRLVEIARLMAADPALKPTTAIKSLGIADPSAIRRLRDKLHASRRELQQEPHDSPSPSSRASPRIEAARHTLRLVASNPVAPDAAPTVAPAAEAAGCAPGPIAMPRFDALGPMAAWFGLGVVAAASAIEQQLALSQQLIRLPAVASLLRQQVAMAELMLAMTAVRPPLPAAAPA